MNLPIAAIAWLYGLTESAYFGWNFFPRSGEEVLADGIALLIFALSIGRRP